MRGARGSWGIPGFAVAALLAAASARAGEITVEWLRSTIERDGIDSVEKLLPALPEAYRREHVLMHESRSAQDASPLKPRVIFSGSDARLLMAFNSGEPAQRGGDLVEVIEFNDSAAAFEFHTIQRGASGRLEIAAGEGCVSCHRADPRPNWFSYNHWPGAYGSRHHQNIRSEHDNHLEFRKKIAPGHPRYRHVPGLDGGVMDRTNTLTSRLFQLNYRRMARLLKAHPDYAKYRYALLGSTRCSQFFEEFFPSGSRPEPGTWGLFGSTEFLDRRSRSTFLYALERMGIDPTLLSTQIQGVANEPFGGNQFGTPGWPHWEFAGQLADADPELAKLASVESTTYAGAAVRLQKDIPCEQLRDLSVSALE